MDNRFLKEISEAYILDTEFDILPDVIFDELSNMVKYIRENDFDLYNELYSVDRLKQQQILKEYLDITIDEHNNEYLSEDAGVVAPFITASISPGMFISMLIFIVAAFYRKGLTKGIFKIISIVGKSLESLGKWVVRRGQYMRLRYAIIQQNAKKCYIRCGISDPNKISALSYFTITTKSAFGTKTSLEQAKCLRECFIENLIEVIALHMESYFACLKKTGAYDAIQKTDTDELLKMIASTNIAAVCHEHYDYARKSLEDFYSTLDLIYVEQFEEDQKLEWIQKLRTRLYEVRNQIQKSDNRTLQRYDNSNKSYQQNQGNKNYQQNQGNKNYQQK